MAFVRLGIPPLRLAAACLGSLLCAACGTSESTTNGPPFVTICGQQVTGSQSFDITSHDAIAQLTTSFAVVVRISQGCDHGASYTVTPSNGVRVVQSVTARNGGAIALSLIALGTQRAATQTATITAKGQNGQSHTLQLLSP